MLTVILGILSSSGMGSLLGWAGGLLNRKIDLQAKKDEFAYNLALRDKDLAQTQAEVAGRTAVQEIESTGIVEVAAYEAMAESYKEQATKLGGSFKWVDAFSKLIRPLITMIFVLCSLWVSGYIIYKANSLGVVFAVEDWKTWLTYVIQWIFFQSGVVIGWWFANRPSGRGKGE